ncbi:MAG: sigma-70 family RNA polymerase sigma factor, partial [Planctomycetota bacterium]
MTKTATETARSVKTAKPSKVQALRQRTEQTLRIELGFIDNPGFREMELNKAEEPNLPLGAVCDLPKHVIRDMPAHLLRLCEVPLLTPAEERDLFQWMNYYKYRANALRSSLNLKRPSEAKLRKIEGWIDRSNAIRNHILRSNTRLVISIVKQLADEKNPFDELLSEGITCLVRVVDKFDFDRGFRFSTYATRAVRREVWRLVQKHHKNRQRFNTGTSEHMESVEGKELADRISESTWKGLTRKLNTILDSLDERERFIVRERFGMNGNDGKRTFQSLGDELGVCKERVRQLEIRAMKKLREMA